MGNMQHCQGCTAFAALINLPFSMKRFSRLIVMKTKVFENYFQNYQGCQNDLLTGFQAVRF